MVQGQHRNLKEKLIRSKQDNNELREELETLPRLKDRLRTLELQLKVDPHCPPLGPCWTLLPLTTYPHTLLLLLVLITHMQIPAHLYCPVWGPYEPLLTPYCPPLRCY